jgi:hypothetical protein
VQVGGTEGLGVASPLRWAIRVLVARWLAGRAEWGGVARPKVELVGAVFAEGTELA